jgi:hypothetical protein
MRATSMKNAPTVRRFLLVLGVVLVLGGVAHAVGVSLRYVKAGVPDANRVLLDVWIGEAQVAAGALFLAARKKIDPGPWALGAALLVWTWALPFLPVLVRRAPPIFWVMPIFYSIGSSIAVRLAWSPTARSG